MARGRPGRKREREFLTQLKNSFKDRGAYFFKIPDMPHFEGAAFRFDIPKPFDAFGVWAGLEFVIEAKVITRYKKFTLRDMQPSQIEGLDAWTKCGGKAYVFIYLWQQERTKECMSAINRVYVYEWSRLKAKGYISRVEMIASPYLERYSVKTEAGSRVYRFNIDSFLLSLAGF